MKNKLLLVALAFLAFSTGANAQVLQVDTQENRREAVAIWSNEKLTIYGAHRPYSTIKLFSRDEEISSTKADASGEFTFNLGSKLDPGQSHDILIKAFDLYDREITKEDGSPDQIKKYIPAGLMVAGTITANEDIPVAGAEVRAYDRDGNLLDRFYTDENGNYSLANLPEDAILKVTGSGVEEQEISLGGRKELNIQAGINEQSPPQYVEPDFTFPTEEKEAASAETTSTKEFNVIELLIWMGIGGAGVVVLWFFWQKKKKM
jgi:hypothetical protein